MSSQYARQYSSQLLFDVGRSKTHARIILIFTVLSVFCVFQISHYFPLLHILLIIFIVVLVTVSFKSNSYKTLQWMPDGDWLIRQTNNMNAALINEPFIKAKLKAGSVVTPFFASLNFVLENKKNINIILFKDNIDFEKFRQLRVRLKVEGIRTDAHDTL